MAGILVIAPAAAAAMTIVALPPAGASATTTVTVTSTGCAKDWTAASTGPQTFTVDNQSGNAGEINLDNAAGAVVAEIETLGPATTAEMTATLGPGSYTFECHMSGKAVTTSATVQVTGKATQNVPAAVKPVTLADLTGPDKEYERYAAGQLRTLAGAITKIRTDLQQDRLNAARTDWLAAQLDWEKVGASYDSFGDDGTAVDGLPDGLVNGVNDKDFTGLHRLEYGLWHGQSAATLLPVVNVLARDVTTVQKNLTSGDLAGDPTNLPLRAHEILEDALRDHLSGIDDQGSGDAYAATYADLQVTRVVLGELAPLINERAPTLLPPDYRADPHGNVIPLDAHIRLANPRTPATASQRLVRRSYNYDLGLDTNGNIQAGHIFVAYQQDVKRQFETVQERLVSEPLIDYVQPFGGGYFYTLPGVADASDWYARPLLA